MKGKLFPLLSLIIIASMLLSACGGQTPTTAPQETQAPVQEATDEPVSEVPAEDPATNEETEGPAEGPTAEETSEPAAEHKGGWLDRIIFSAISEVGPAVEQLKAGAIDMYAVSSEDASIFEDVKASSDLAYSTSYGSNNQMLFNTTACADTSAFNPFTLAEVREAMNWAIDRTYISEEIMDGLAQPKFSPFTGAFPDYSRYADLFNSLEMKYAYDLEKAREAVTAAMTGAGAELVSGKWQMNGSPVEVIVLIRTEDSRKEIGNYFANQLEDLGFTVERQEKVRTEASPIWAESDPADCKWHVYTSGWISQNITRDEGANFVQFNTGKMQNLPVFNNFTPSEELMEVSDRLFTNDFSSMEERRELFTEALDLSMKESWWGVWVTDNTGFSPYDPERVTGAYDLASGFGSSQLFPFTIRIPEAEGGEVKIAQSGILVEAWNPIAGSNWTDDGMVQRFTYDWGAVSDPYTGLILPKLVEKAELTAVEGLPIEKSSDWIDLAFTDEIQVPGDAWADWDAENQRWITVEEKYPEGITAKTRSVVYYTPALWDTTWHDGSNMSIADFVMYMILTFDLGKEASPVYDEVMAPGVETLLTHLKGVKIVSTDPLVIETYDDTYTLDAENTIATWYPDRYIPASAPLGMISWHGLVPALLAEENGELAFSADKAGALEIERTSMISGPSLEVQAKYLDQALADQYIPYAATMSEYLTPEEAAARYENLKNYYNERKHMWLGTGPYYVEQVYPVEQTITLVPYEDYIFDVNQWSSFSEPKLADAVVEGPISIAAGDEATFDVSIFFGDEPYPAGEIDSVSYMLYDAEKNLVETGEAVAVADGLYQIVLTADQTSALTSGASRLVAAVTSQVVSIPAFAEYEFMVQ